MADDITRGGLEGLVNDEASSLLDQLAERRQAVADTKDTFIEIAGYDKEPPILLAHYRLVEGPELAKIADKVRTEFRGRWDRNLYAAIDTMIVACDGIYIDKGDGKPVPLTLNGDPITGYNNALAEGLRYVDKLRQGFTHRDVVLGLFGGNELAIAEHNARLNRWFGDTSADVSKDFLGNL